MERKKIYDRVDEPLTAARLAAIPVANASMTTDELRRICVDYVCLSVSFQWVSNVDYEYSAKQGKAAPIIEGKLYGGIPYVNTASGNLYRVLDRYDPETGVWDLRPFVENRFLYGTACSGTAGWGWARVVNSAVCKWTHDLNTHNGLVRVGPYVYDDSIVRFGAEGAPKTTEIAAANGEQTIYGSYALTLPGDCMVTNGHVRMVKEKPVVVRNPDGTIDGEKSYIVHCEQGLFVDGEWHDRVSKRGIPYKIQGNDGRQYFFAELCRKGYLPHTFKEFLGLKKIEPARASFEGLGDSVSASDLYHGTLTSNYVISDVFTEVFGPEGKPLYRYAAPMRDHFSFAVSGSACLPAGEIEKFQIADPANTVAVSCRLGNGETVEAYRGALKA